MEERPNFGDLLRRHRLAAGFTQEALAERAGLSVRGLSDLERGARRTPYPDTLRRLVTALALSEAERAEFEAVRTHRLELDVGGDQRALPPSNLPAPLTNFIGRERELGDIQQLLDTNRLLTLVGPGALESLGWRSKVRTSGWPSTRPARGWWIWRRWPALPW